MYNQRDSYRKMVSLSQSSLILLSGDVAVNSRPVRLSFVNCRFIRIKNLLFAEEVKNGGYDVFGLTETHIKAHDTSFFLQELTPEDFTLVHTPRVNKNDGGVGFYIVNVHVDSVSPLVLEFKSMVEACSLTQCIDFPIHLHAHTLDLLLLPTEF